MIRTLYRCVLWLHPPAFRRRFGDEMTWLFEEAGTEMSSGTLLADGLASLVRQWAMNPSVWKIVVIGLGSLVYLVPYGSVRDTHRFPSNTASVLTSPDFFLVAMVAPLVTISIGLIFAVGSFRFIQRRRH